MIITLWRSQRIFQHAFSTLAKNAKRPKLSLVHDAQVKKFLKTQEETVPQPLVWSSAIEPTPERISVLKSLVATNTQLLNSYGYKFLGDVGSVCKFCRLPASVIHKQNAIDLGVSRDDLHDIHSSRAGSDLDAREELSPSTTTNENKVVSTCNRLKSQSAVSESAIPRNTETSLQLSTKSPARDSSVRPKDAISRPELATVQMISEECINHPEPLHRHVYSKQVYCPCCNEPLHAPGCQQSPSHVLVSDDVTEETRDGIYKKKYMKTPPTDSLSQKDKRIAVALDCEMAGDYNNHHILVKLSMVDYFTGETLIDNLIKPNRPVLTYRTQFSGVSETKIDKAREDGTLIKSMKSVHKRIWEYVGEDTIVIAHGGFSDLMALEWKHPHIVDTLMVASETFRVQGQKSLKSLTLKLLGQTIQNHGEKGHDSLEDSMACRELTIHFTKKLLRRHSSTSILKEIESNAGKTEEISISDQQLIRGARRGSE